MSTRALALVGLPWLILHKMNIIPILSLAANLLVDPSHWREFLAQNTYHTKAAIQAFAQNEGIAPGIIVGRLQHEKLLPFTHCNDLKSYLEWPQDLAEDSQ